MSGPIVDWDADGGPAVPTQDATNFYPVMTLRDWFAGQALGPLSTDARVFDDDTASHIAGLAYRFADAMLAERDKHRS